MMTEETYELCLDEDSLRILPVEESDQQVTVRIITEPHTSIITGSNEDDIGIISDDTSGMVSVLKPEDHEQANSQQPTINIQSIRTSSQGLQPSGLGMASLRPTPGPSLGLSLTGIRTGATAGHQPTGGLALAGIRAGPSQQQQHPSPHPAGGLSLSATGFRAAPSQQQHQSTPAAGLSLAGIRTGPGQQQQQHATSGLSLAGIRTATNQPHSAGLAIAGIRTVTSSHLSTATPISLSLATGARAETVFSQQQQQPQLSAAGLSLTSLRSPPQVSTGGLSLAGLRPSGQPVALNITGLRAVTGQQESGLSLAGLTHSTSEDLAMGDEAKSGVHLHQSIALETVRTSLGQVFADQTLGVTTSQSQALSSLTATVSVSQPQPVSILTTSVSSSQPHVVTLTASSLRTTHAEHDQDEVESAHLFYEDSGQTFGGSGDFEVLGGSSKKLVPLVKQEKSDDAAKAMDDDDEEEDYTSELLQHVSLYLEYGKDWCEDLMFELAESVDRWADYPVYCTDGIVWTNPAILGCLNVKMKNLLISAGPDSCIIAPQVTKAEFDTFFDHLLRRETEYSMELMRTLLKVADIFDFPIKYISFDQNNNENIVDYPVIFHNQKEEYVQKISSQVELAKHISKLSNVQSGERMINRPRPIISMSTGVGDKVLPLWSNLQTTDKNSYIPCSKCNREFAKQEMLDTHMQIVHSGSVSKDAKDVEKPFKCPECDARFTYGVNVWRHVKLVHYHKEQPAPSQTNRDVCEEVDVEERTCKICKKVVRNKRSLIAHIQEHFGKRFKCEFPGCAASFKEKTKLRRHQLKHSGAKPFECENCGTKFSLRHNMRYHMKAHCKNNQAPRLPNIQCGLCALRFYSKSELDEHLLEHTKEKNFVLARGIDSHLGSDEPHDDIDGGHPSFVDTSATVTVGGTRNPPDTVRDSHLTSSLDTSPQKLSGTHSMSGGLTGEEDVGLATLDMGETPDDIEKFIAAMQEDQMHLS